MPWATFQKFAPTGGGWELNSFAASPQQSEWYTNTSSTIGRFVSKPASSARVNRASSARDYLSARGVDSRRILISGRGSYEPIADNNSEMGRSKNRRIEIFLAERSSAQR